MVWVRIDNRLIHGQIIETWLPFTGAKRLVVADDALAEDSLRQEIMSLAIPDDVDLTFSRVDSVPRVVGNAAAGQMPGALVLFSSCQDARRGFQAGLHFETLNIGNLHYAPGKRQLCAHVALSSEDESCLDYFSGQGVALDFRCVPGDTVQIRWA